MNIDWNQIWNIILQSVIWLFGIFIVLVLWYFMGAFLLKITQIMLNASNQLQSKAAFEIPPITYGPIGLLLWPITFPILFLFCSFLIAWAAAIHYLNLKLR